jgi:hypothetical protein
MPKRRVLFTGVNLALLPGAIFLFLRVAACQGLNAAPPTGGVPPVAVTAIDLVG